MKKTQIWKFFYWPAVWFIALWPWRVPAWHGGMIWNVMGMLLISYGLLVHIIAGKTLKFLGHTPQNSSIWPDKLVDAGIYSQMRHPQHLGLMLIPLGIACMISTFQALLASGWTAAAALFFIVVIEEPECIEKFGSSYFQYMKNTPAFTLRPSAVLGGLKFLKTMQEE